MLFLSKLNPMRARRLSRSAAFLSILGATLILSACTATNSQNLASSARTIPTNQGIVVIGVKGDGAGVFRRGSYFSDGSFEHDTARGAEFSAPKEQPYIVRSLNVTTDSSRYGMYRATLGGREFSFKCGQILPVLSVESDAVQYYGDFEVAFEDGRLTVKQSFDLERAQKYIDRVYPNSNWKLEPGEVVRGRSTQCVVAPPAAILG